MMTKPNELYAHMVMNEMNELLEMLVENPELTTYENRLFLVDKMNTTVIPKMRSKLVDQQQTYLSTTTTRL